MTESITIDRRPILGPSIIAALFALAIWLLYWLPFGNYDRGPDCEPGLAQIAQSVTPTSLSYCFPDTILQRNFPVIPPK